MHFCKDGISHLVALLLQRGLKAVIITSPSCSQEKMDSIRAYGAELIVAETDDESDYMAVEVSEVVYKLAMSEESSEKNIYRTATRDFMTRE